MGWRERFANGVGVLAVALFAAPASSVRAQDELPLGERAYLLERALEDAYWGFDGLSLVAIVRAATTTVFETYCAASGLLPDANGYDELGLTVGAGCLVGATALALVTARRIADFGAPADRAEILARYRLGRRARLSEATVLTFERELEQLAAHERFRRNVSVVMGAGSLVASGTLAVLTADGAVDRATGASIAVTTAIVAAVSFFALLADGPAETALETYRAATRP